MHKDRPSFTLFVLPSHFSSFVHAFCSSCTLLALRAQTFQRAPLTPIGKRWYCFPMAKFRLDLVAASAASRAARCGYGFAVSPERKKGRGPQSAHAVSVIYAPKSPDTAGRDLKFLLEAMEVSTQDEVFPLSMARAEALSAFSVRLFTAHTRGACEALHDLTIEEQRAPDGIALLLRNAAGLSAHTARAVRNAEELDGAKRKGKFARKAQSPADAAANAVNSQRERSAEFDGDAHVPVVSRVGGKYKIADELFSSRVVLVGSVRYTQLPVGVWAQFRPAAIPLALALILRHHLETRLRPTEIPDGYALGLDLGIPRRLVSPTLKILSSMGVVRFFGRSMAPVWVLRRGEEK